MTIRVLITDDQGVLRQGLRKAIKVARLSRELRAPEAP